MTLRVLEHQKIHIKKFRDFEKLQISQSDAEIIRTVDQKNGFVFKWGNDYVIPQQWVGVISFKDFSLEILPKISDIINTNKSCEILYKMIVDAYDIPTKRDVNASIQFVKNGLVDVFIANYIELIKNYIQSGIVLDYKKNTKNIKSVKGNIVFSEQINHNSMNTTKFMCKFSKMDIDNKYNRLIKLTLVNMKNLSQNSPNNNAITNLLAMFDMVKLDCNLDYSHVFPDKTHYKLHNIIQYSRLFLDNYSVSLNSGNHNVISLLFDMNKLFEKYIYIQLKKIHKQNLQYQYSKEFLLQNIKSGIKQVKLKPDMYLKTSNGDIVIDTKWKIINSRIKESDAYQMNAYLSVLKNAKRSLLIYPQSKNSVEINESYVVQDKEKEKVISTKTVALELLLDNNINGFKNRLDSLIKELDYNDK